MFKLQYLSLDKIYSSLGFGLNQAGLDKLQARGLYQGHTIRSLSNEIFNTWQMRNTAFALYFANTPDGFVFGLETSVKSIEETWEEQAQHWNQEAQKYLNGAGASRPRSIESLRGRLIFSTDDNRAVNDNSLLQAVLENRLDFEGYQKRIKHLRKSAEQYLLKFVKQHHLDQIVDTTDQDSIVFAEYK
ncbi:hypothetical protein MUB04_15425 [Acinetobacter indicus]|uniref:hypothetical protein n=1 Tax=Acinetobacter TaxID=469 RepID=UPI0015D3FACF|nr:MULTISPECIES: hypothetical protein [Acinetobacter]MCP0917927.1 hypothetical protein [Acinetobacter indicus]